MKLLHLDSSVLADHSVSRTLTREIVEHLSDQHPGLEVVYHDLADERVPHLTFSHVGAWQGAPVEDAALAADLEKGDAYIDELLAADIIVIGAPMYNFSIPTTLKAWIDRVACAGKTFRYTANGPESLLAKGKKAIVASSRGNIYTPGAPAAFLDHQEAYLKGLLAFLGVEDVVFVRAEGVNLPENRDKALGEARVDITTLA